MTTAAQRLYKALAVINNQAFSFKDAWLGSLESIAASFKGWNDMASGIMSKIGEGLATALEAVGASLVQQKFDWADMGKMALQMLAEMLRSIAAQLAGLAAVHALAFDWVGAALAAAAAAAALIAAGVAGGIANNMSSATSEQASAAASSSGSYSAGASYTGSRSVVLNFFNQGNVVGSGGLQELAHILDSIIKQEERYA